MGGLSRAHALREMLAMMGIGLRRMLLEEGARGPHLGLVGRFPRGERQVGHEAVAGAHVVPVAIARMAYIRAIDARHGVSGRFMVVEARQNHDAMRTLRQGKDEGDDAVVWRCGI